MAHDVLHHVGYIDLPRHWGNGAFDHAAVHAESGHVYVAHTANDAVDVFDPAAGRHLFSVPDLPGVAGALVSDESQLVITSNRTENTIGLFAPAPDPEVHKIAVGLRPNGLAYDPERRLVLVANLGDPAISGSHTLSMVDLRQRKVRADIPVSGRTRWAIYDPHGEIFYVNIADPPQVVVVTSRDPDRVATAFPIPAAGPHGLDLDRARRRLFCACDGEVLITIDAESGKILGEHELSGAPDVVFFDARTQRLYVAIGHPGVIDVFDAADMELLGSVPTEKGAHTLAIASDGEHIYAFLPATHRAAVYTAKGR